MDEMKDDRMLTKAAGRRNFLKLAGLGTIAGAAAVVGTKSVQAAEPAAKGDSGYRETEHVKKFYETARF